MVIPVAAHRDDHGGRPAPEMRSVPDGRESEGQAVRFITYADDGGEGIGLRDGAEYRGLPVAVLGRELKATLHDAAAMGALAEALSRAPRLDTDAITLLPPIVRPGKIVCIGLNYADHSAESGFAPPNYPTVFARFASSLIGHDAPLVRPNASDMFDYEGELAVVIGRSGRHISRAQALEHVAGYAVFNDGSVRDFQRRSPQWTMGKVFDGTGAFGPELVTADELPPGCRGLTLRTSVNGRTVQSALIDDMIFDVAALVSILSEVMTLSPGDVIVSGTPAGVGAARTPPLWLKPGDECVVEIEAIGRLVNRVVQEAH